MKDEVFSPREQDILTILGRRKMTISEIAEELFDNKAVGPLDANNVIAGSIRRINKKCEMKRLPWFLNGYGAGRAGRTVWREKR